MKKPVITSNDDMMNALGMQNIGKQGDSLDDAKNLTDVILKLYQSGFVFNQAMIIQK